METTEREALRARLDQIATALTAAYAALDESDAEMADGPPRRRITGNRAGVDPKDDVRVDPKDDVSPYSIDEDGSIHVLL
jgi:hypothetical protein